MATVTQDGLTKRSLEETRGNDEEGVKEKRPRLESGISDISDVDVALSTTNKEESEVIADRIEVEEQAAAEVIYELSPDNNGSLLSVPASPLEGDSPKEKEKEESEQEEMVEQQESEEEEESEEVVSEKEISEKEVSEKEEVEDKVKEEEEESSGSGESDESSSSSDDDSEEEKNDDVEIAEVRRASEDDEDAEDTRDSKDKRRSKMVQKDDVAMLSESESDEEDEKQDNKPQTKTREVKAKVVEGAHSEDEHSSESDKEETVPNSRKETKQKKPEDTADGKGLFGKSDYSKKSVEDLEDLQEDIHKELAQITGGVLQKKKHKKTSSSSSRREKRHKEKTSSRYRGKEERTRERERYRKDIESRHKHRDFEEKPKSYEPRRDKPEKAARRDRGEKSSWTRSQGEHSPKRLVTKGRKDEVETKKESFEAQNEGRKNGGKKGPISDSLREMIRAGVKEMKNEAPKDMRGFYNEVVDYESDESGEHDILQDRMSDISAASSSTSESEEESPPKVPKLPPYLPAIQGCRNVEEFQWLNRIEEGTYGVVYRAKDKRSGEVVALKKLKMEKEKEGFPITSLREINTLLKAQHPNIVTVQEIVVGNNMDKIYIVMDFVEHDLKALMETMTQAFLGGEIKTIMIQLLRAVNHLHDNWILHRDIKTSNLLLSNKGILKVGDFGLAREYGSPLKPYTPIVVTLWYRSPELLLGAKEYSTPVDLWSVGCVFAELLTMKPLFNGQSEISQINKIFKELGTPSDKIWPGPPAYSEYPATKKMTFAEYPYNNLRNKFGATLTDNGFDLLNSFLTYDPKRRITAEAALKHQYFQESPKPVDPSMFPSWPARSEGAKRAKKASPKAPEGGNFYQTLSGDGDGAFHIPAGKSQGSSAVSGFTLKF